MGKRIKRKEIVIELFLIGLWLYGWSEGDVDRNIKRKERIALLVMDVIYRAIGSSAHWTPLLDGIQPNERCFEPELNSGLMNEEEKKREPDDSRT